MTGMPSGWQLVTLEELQSAEPRSIVDGPFGSNLKSSHYSASGARVIRLQNIGDGFYREGDAFIPLEHFEALRKHEAREGDLIVASLGDGLPRACLVPPNFGPAIVKADCIRVRLSEEVEPQWVLYALQRPEAKKWAADQLHGVGRQRLGLGAIRRTPIPIPPLDEQRRIVSILEDHLSRLEAATQGLGRVRELSKTLVRSVLASEFSREEMEGTQRGASIPLGEVASVTDCEHRTAKPAKPGDEYGYSVRTMDVADGRIHTGGARRVSREDFEMFTRRAIPSQGDLILSREAPVGQVGVVTGEWPLCLGQRTVLIRPAPDIIRPRFLMYTLTCPQVQGWMSEHSTGTTVLHLNVADVRRIPIPRLPPLAAQDQVLAQLDRHLDESERLDRVIVNVEERARVLRKSMLTAAFSGQLMDDYLSQSMTTKGVARV